MFSDSEGQDWGWVSRRICFGAWWSRLENDTKQRCDLNQCSMDSIRLMMNKLIQVANAWCIFWSLQVQSPFRLTKACLEPSTAGSKVGSCQIEQEPIWIIHFVFKVSSVMVENSDGENYIIANLNQVLTSFTLILDPVSQFKRVS